MRRAFLTGFGGSAGTAVVTQDEALLWTDSRYWNEASSSLDSSLWTLVKQGQPKTKTITKHLGDLAAERFVEHGPLKVGIDPFVVSFLRFGKTFSYVIGRLAHAIFSRYAPL
jgi:Xaa-Pro aminopeptidase